MLFIVQLQIKNKKSEYLYNQNCLRMTNDFGLDRRGATSYNYRKCAIHNELWQFSRMVLLMMP